MPRCSAAAGLRTMQKNRGREVPSIVVPPRLTNRPSPLMNRMVLRPSFDSDGRHRLDLMRPAHYYYEKSPALAPSLDGE